VRCGTGLACLTGEVKTDGGKGLAEGRAGGLDRGVQSPGPPPHPQALEDAEHLKLLSIFHYVLAGMTALAGCIPIIHVVLGIVMVSGSLPTSPTSPPPPAAFGWFFIGFGGLFILLAWTMAVLQFLTARWIAARRRRMFCFVMACIECAAIPVGTALGVFTILVLQRPSVRALFDEPPPGGGYLNR
jgi:hypothetical protein